MGNNKKNAAKNAAKEAAAAQEAPQTKGLKEENKGVAVIQLGDLDKLAQSRALAGLDPNHAEDLLARLDKRFFDDKSAATRYGISQETVDKINEITAIGFVALFVNEVEMAQTPFAVRMRKTQLENLREAARVLKVDIDTTLALPAPNCSDDVVELPSNAIKPSKEAKEAAAEERAAANSKAETLDPTKIENEDQLKASLLKLLVSSGNNSNFYDKVVTTVSFYQAYLKVKANKAENRDEELAKINEMKTADFLTDIAHILGKCPFTAGGMAKFMYENTERSKSPIVAFCTLRDASLNKKTGMPQIDDQVVADIVKVLIRWYADSLIQEANDRIAGFERDIEALKKDEKKNAKGIEQGKKTIEAAKASIEKVETIVSYCNMPINEVVNNFVEDYKDSNREGYKMARMIANKIMNTYYPGIVAKEMDQDNLLHNLQQYAGVISNLFLPPLNKLANYSEAHITELKKKDDSKTEEKNA